ncbi:MAG: 30S ribosomal protein S17e [Nitrososphaeria archaeon]|nr:30S ribosomal protein S17e [Nitrososphaeria archaeon]
MGIVRNLALMLIEKYGKEFTTDFEENKKIVGKYVKFYSKGLRNMVAGYITSYMRKLDRVEEGKEGVADQS